MAAAAAFLAGPESSLITSHHGNHARGNRRATRLPAGAAGEACRTAAQMDPDTEWTQTRNGPRHGMDPDTEWTQTRRSLCTRATECPPFSQLGDLGPEISS